jgi:hypothetical protein
MKGHWELTKDGDEGTSRITEVGTGFAIGGFIPDEANPQEIVDAHNKAIDALSYQTK